MFRFLLVPVSSTYSHLISHYYCIIVTGFLMDRIIMHVIAHAPQIITSNLNRMLQISLHSQHKQILTTVSFVFFLKYVNTIVDSVDLIL